MAQKRVTKVAVGEDSRWKKLALLRETTRRTGLLHEIQVLQLQMWPLVFLNAESSTAEFGFDTKQVVFTVSFKKGKKPTKFKERLNHLSNATQKLLGEEYGVVVMDGKRRIHYGRPIIED